MIRTSRLDGKGGLPGTARQLAVAMAVDEKGYLEPDTTVPIT